MTPPQQFTPQQLDSMIQAWQARLDAKVLERHSLTSLCGHAHLIAVSLLGPATKIVGDITPDASTLKEALHNLWTAQIATLDIDISEISANLQVAKQASQQAKSGILLAGAMPPNNRKV